MGRNYKRSYNTFFFPTENLIFKPNLKMLKHTVNLIVTNVIGNSVNFWEDQIISKEKMIQENDFFAHKKCQRLLSELSKPM